MRYQRCKHFDEGYCYNMGLRNGLNTLGCVGYDRCDSYKTEQKLPESGRIDPIGQNGNTGEHYIVEKVARAICHPLGADDFLMGINKGKRRWELFIPNAMRVLEVIEDEQ